MVFKVHKARQSKNKVRFEADLSGLFGTLWSDLFGLGLSQIKLAMKLGMGRGMAAAAAAAQADVKVHTEDEQGSTIEVKGKQWEVMVIAGDVVQLKLVGVGTQAIPTTACLHRILCMPLERLLVVIAGLDAEEVPAGAGQRGAAKRRPHVVGSVCWAWSSLAECKGFLLIRTYVGTR